MEILKALLITVFGTITVINISLITMGIMEIVRLNKNIEKLKED